MSQAGRDDRGFTLVEMMMAVFIMGIAIVAVVGALASAVTASEHHRGAGAVDTVVRAYGEAVKKHAQSTTVAAKQCPTQSDLQPTTGVGGEFTVSSSTFKVSWGSPSVQYWIPSSADPRAGSWGTAAQCANYYATECDTDTSPSCAPWAVLVSFSVTALEGQNRGATTSTQVVVRRTNQ